MRDRTGAGHGVNGRRWRATVPDGVTLLRMGMAFPLCAMVIAGHTGAAMALLFAAWLTDMLDGWLARRWKQAPGWGAALDTAADCTVAALMALGVVWRGGLHPATLAALALMIVEGLYVLCRLARRNRLRDLPHLPISKLLGVGLFLSAVLMILERPEGEVLLVLTVLILGSLTVLAYVRIAPPDAVPSNPASPPQAPPGLNPRDDHDHAPGLRLNAGF